MISLNVTAPSRSAIVSRKKLSFAPYSRHAPIAFSSNRYYNADAIGGVCEISSRALFLELDGAVTDLHMDGHRMGFNNALKRLGVQRAVFTPQLYNELLAAGDGSAVGMAAVYFNCFGWPKGLTDHTDRVLLARQVADAKAEELSLLLKDDMVPLRPHVSEVIADAIRDNVKVCLIAGTISDSGDEVASSVLRQLDPDLRSHVRVFNCSQSRGELIKSQQQEDGEMSIEMSMGMMIKDAQDREKQRSAAAFVSSLDQPDSPMPIMLSNNLIAQRNRRQVTAEFLAALTAACGVKLGETLLAASSVAVAQAGCAAGMTTVAIPRRMAFNGSFPGVAAKMEGYGVGSATWPRLRGVLMKARAVQK